VRRCERNNSADTKVSEEGGGRRCLRRQSRESSLAAHDEDHGEAGCSPCSPWRSTLEQISTCSPWKGPHTRAGRCLKEAVTLWGAHAGAGLLAGPVTLWGTHTAAACS